MKFTKHSKCKRFFFLTPTFSNEVMSNIDNLKTSKAIRHIDVETKFLKPAKPVISPVLSNLINECFNNGEYPKCLQIAEVKHCHKYVDLR